MGAKPSGAAKTAFPQRIITFAPNITETVFALGAGDRVVGISDYCNYPAEAKSRKRCGAYAPNYEAVLSLQPDLVLVIGESVKMRRFCEERRIPLMSLQMNSIACIETDIMSIGKALGVEDSATSLCRKIEADLAPLRKGAKAAKPKVFISISRSMGAMNSLLTAGGGTFLDEMVTLAGGENIFADRREPYPKVSKESLIQRQPEVILDLCPGEAMDEARRKAMLGDWAPLGSLPAVKQNRVVIINDDFVQIAGPRLAKIAALFREALKDSGQNK